MAETTTSLCTSYFNSQLYSPLLITYGRLLKKFMKPLIRTDLHIAGHEWILLFREERSLADVQSVFTIVELHKRTITIPHRQVIRHL